MTPDEENRLLEDLVRCKSPSGEEAEASTLLTSRFLALGFEAHVDAAGSAVIEAGSGDTTICMLGHIDTVDGWPDVRLDGDILHGRGTVDAKGPLCAFACALARLSEADLAGRRVVVIGAVEEEASSSKGARYVRDRMTPDYCIIGEPSGSRGITLGYKGRLALRAVVTASRAHSAADEPTAAERGVQLWQRIVEHAAAAGGEREFDRVSPTLLGFVTDSDGLHERATLDVSVRLPTPFDAEAYRAFLAAAAPDATIDLRGHEPAFRGNRANPLVKAFNRAIRRDGDAPRYVLKTGTSDMNVVGPQWACPIVAYGPGDSSLDHTPEEHVSLAEYQHAIGVLADVLRSLPPVENRDR